MSPRMIHELRVPVGVSDYPGTPERPLETSQGSQ